MTRERARLKGCGAKRCAARRRMPVAMSVAAAMVVAGAIVWLAVRRGEDASGAVAPQSAGRAESRQLPSAPPAPRHAVPPDGNAPAFDEKEQRQDGPFEFADGRTSEWSKKFSRDSKWSCTTNDFGEVVEIVRDGKKTHKRRCLAKPPLFDNQIDQAIAMVVCGGADDMIAPFPVRKFTNEEVRAALEREMPFADDEPEELRQKKEAVLAARKEVLRLMDEGMSFDEIIKSSREEQNANIDLRRHVAKECMEMLETSGAEAAEEYRIKANEILRSKGIDEIGPISVNQ